MRKQTPFVALAACVATLSSIEISTAQAKQKCSAAMPSNPHGYWSWRLIDGRKCWYEGKPTLSKSSLEWPMQASARPNSDQSTWKRPARQSRQPIGFTRVGAGRYRYFRSAVARDRNDALGAGFRTRGNCQHCGARKRPNSAVSAPCLHLFPDASTSDRSAR